MGDVPAPPPLDGLHRRKLPRGSLETMTGRADRTVRLCGRHAGVRRGPEVAAKAPAVIVVHERYGLVKPHLRPGGALRARRLRRHRARSLFPAPGPSGAASRRRRLRHQRSGRVDCARIRTIDALQAIPQADLSRLAIMGICQTGAAAARGRGVPPGLRGAGLVRRGPAARMGRSTAKYPASARRHHRRRRLSGARHVRRDRSSDFD